MHALLVSVVAVILGVFAAWGATRLEFATGEHSVPSEAADAARAKAAELEATHGVAKFELEGKDTFDFGLMELGESREHVFTFRNVGTGPMSIEAGRPTCKCTVSEMAEGLVFPGEQRTVKLTWKPTSADEKFRQMAPFQINDPDHPLVELKIVGKVREAIKVEPSPLTLGQFSPTETNSYDVRVWANRDKPWKLLGHTCSDADTEPFFQIEARDMTQEELDQSPGSYYGQVLKLSVKPGIPLGNVQQKITLSHNYEDREPLELRVTGKSVGDVTVLGKDFDAQHDFVDLGNVPSSQGKKTSLTLVVKGPHRDQVKFKIKSIDPAASLRAELGEPVVLGGKSISWPLTVEIPRGAEPVNRLGSKLGRMARIELDSGTPDFPGYALQVRLVVTGDE